MEERNLPQIVIGKFKEHKARIFSSAGDWERHLQALGLSGLKVAPDPVLVASEAALWGAIHHQGLLPDTVIVSDDAGQFRVGAHALCWIHAERLVHKLVPANDKQRNAIEIAKRMIWWFYRALKEYKLTPSAEQAQLLRARFDRIFKRASTGYATLDRLLRRLFRNKDGLLRVLERPEIPINTNASENDIRAFVTKRKISGGTVSDKGRDARDIMLGLAKTCMKLKLSFYDFIGARLGIPGPNIPHLASLIRQVTLWQFTNRSSIMMTSTSAAPARSSNVGCCRTPSKLSLSKAGISRIFPVARPEARAHRNFQDIRFGQRQASRFL